MKVLITAGGTTEPIDSVRSIKNTSTGKLGCLIAEAYGKFSKIEKIYFICGTSSLLPESEKAEVIFVDTVKSLEATVRNVISNDTIDIIIHSMAVSDYRVEAVTSLPRLADGLNSKLESIPIGSTGITETFIHSLLHSPEVILERDSKISSDIDELVLTMKKNPKIISIFQSIAPQATLVGFKLLDHVDFDTLIDTAYRILTDNKCSFVLANDLSHITKEQHIGYLLNEDKSYTRLQSKEEIAEAIVAATVHIRGEIL
jgi:phosphopantothenate-cysteine ligase